MPLPELKPVAFEVDHSYSIIFNRTVNIIHGAYDKYIIRYIESFFERVIVFYKVLGRKPSTDGNGRATVKRKGFCDRPAGTAY